MPLSTRRQFLARTALASGALAFGPRALTGEKDTGPRGKAEHCLFIWLGGGMAHIDTFDPKPQRGDPQAKKAGSYYDCIDTAIPGVPVCEHLPQIAKIYDRFVPVRTVHHNVIDEHAAAANRMHTGRPVSGSVVYPSVGSIIAHEKRRRHTGCAALHRHGLSECDARAGFSRTQSGLRLSDRYRERSRRTDAPCRNLE